MNTRKNSPPVEPLGMRLLLVSAAALPFLLGNFVSQGAMSVEAGREILFGEGLFMVGLLLYNAHRLINERRKKKKARGK